MWRAVRLAVDTGIHSERWSREAAIENAAGYFEENLKIFGPLRLVRSLSDEQIEIMSDPKQAPYADLPKLQNAVDAGAFLCGNPEQVIEQLQRLEEQYPGLDRIGMSQPVGVPQSVILEQLQRLSEEVMPAFKGRVEAAAPAD